MNEYEEIKGSWVTVKGKHIFIRDGESTQDAFNRTFGIKNAPSEEPEPRKDVIKKHQTRLTKILAKYKDNIADASIEIGKLEKQLLAENKITRDEILLAHEGYKRPKKVV